MYRFNKPFSVSQFLSLVLLSLLLSACASTPDNSSNAPTVPPSAFSRLEHKPDWYLQQLAQADAAYRFTWETLAARSLIASGDLQQASAISQQLAKEAFTPLQKDQQRLVQALLNPPKKVEKAKDRDLLRLEEELSDLLMAEVEVRVKKRVKRGGRTEEMGELAIQFGSLDALNGLIERLRAENV